MELTYTAQGNYMIPDLTLPKEVMHLGKYGMLRKTFLKNHRKVMYASMMLSGKLNSHLSEIDLTARKCIERITTKLLENRPAPDKTSSQMAWVGYMNNLKNQAEETVLAELIYS